MKKAVCYARCSTDDRQQLSISEQLTELRAAAPDQGFEIAAIFEDEGQRRWTEPDERPGWIALMRYLDEHHDVRHIIILKINRLIGHTDPNRLIYYEQGLVKRGIEIHYLADHATSFDKNIADRIQKLLASEESTKYVRGLSEDTLRGLKTLAQDGYWLGGRPPYGYDLLYHDPSGKPYAQVRFVGSSGTGDRRRAPMSKEVIDPATGKMLMQLGPKERFVPRTEPKRCRLTLSSADRVQVVRDIFEMYFEKSMGQRTIACTLNEKGVPSPKGGKWGTGSVHTILTSPLYAGAMVWNRLNFSVFNRVEKSGGSNHFQTVPKDLHPSDDRNGHGLAGRRPTRNSEDNWIKTDGANPEIIPSELAQKVLLERKARIKERKNPVRRKYRTYLMSGIMECPRCGSAYSGRMTTNKKGVGSRYYVCGASDAGKGCIRGAVHADTVEQLVVNAVEKRVSEAIDQKALASRVEALLRDALKHPSKDDVTDIEDEVARVNEQLAEYKAMRPSLQELNVETIEALMARSSSLQGVLERQRKAAHASANVDLRLLVKHALAGIKRLREVLKNAMKGGMAYEAKTLMAGFVSKVRPFPERGVVEVDVYAKIDLLAAAGAGLPDGSIAGARFPPFTLLAFSGSGWRRPPWSLPQLHPAVGLVAWREGEFRQSAPRPVGVACNVHQS